MGAKKIIIVGAGFGGLSAANLLAHAGFDVTVLEKNSQPGGRAMVYKDQGFTFDMGPSWYLMPDVFEKYFAEFGRHPEDYYTLERLDPSYRLFFGGDKIIDIAASLEENIALFEELEAGGGEKFQKYLDQAQYQYEVSMREFIYKEYRTIFDFFNTRLLFEGFRLNVFSRLEKFVAKFFSHERAQKILQYNIVFLGGNPKNTPAIYSLMAHVDFNLGVWYPQGGMGSVVQGLCDLGRELGVTYHFDQPVTSLEVKSGMVQQVLTERDSFQGDLVLVNADYPHAEMNFLEKPFQTYPEKYWEKRTMAPSAFILYLGLDKKIDQLEHHNLFLENDWMEHFDEIFSQPAWPDRPSYYVCCPSKTDPTVAPPGKDALFVLVPVASGLEDSDQIRQEYRDKIITHLEKLLGENIRNSIETERIFSHRNFKNLFNAYKGTALGMSHTLLQTAIFRPSHGSKKVDNLYYTGQYTHPGIGVPMSIISSQIVAGEILKDHPRSKKKILVKD